MDSLAFLTHIEGRVAARDQARALYAEQLAPDFTPFEFLDTRETALSRVIRWMLDPKGSHAQGSRFLDAFIDWLALSDAGDSCDWAGAHVRTEVSTSYEENRGYVDILITSQGRGIAIENKPFATDQHNQLARYLADLERRCPNGQWLLYLSGQGSDPTEIGISTSNLDVERASGRLVVRSFTDLTEWLDRCIACCRAPNVVAMIRGFSTFVSREFSGVQDMDEVEDLATAIVSNPERLNAALAVFEAEKSTRQKLIDRFVADLRRQVETRDGWSLARADMNDTNQSGVAIALNGSKALFGLQFDKANYRYLYYGVQIPDGGELDEKVLSCIASIAGKGGAAGWWPYWRQVGPSDRFFPLKRELNREFWLTMSDGRLAQMMIDYVDAVVAALSNRRLRSKFERSS